MIVLHRSVMLPCGIDILMSQNVCNEVNIPGFLIQRRAVGGTELMRRDLFVVVTREAYFLTRFSTLRTAMRRFCRDKNNASSWPLIGIICLR